MTASAATTEGGLTLVLTQDGNEPTVDTDYSYANGVLAIESSTAMIISGGKVIAQGGGVRDDGTSGENVIPTDGADNVYLLTLDVDGINEVTIDGSSCPKKHFDENKLYVYLPAKTIQEPNTIVIDAFAIGCYYDTVSSEWKISGTSIVIT